jgi:glycosidase
MQPILKIIFVISILVLSSSAIAQNDAATLDRLDPPFWWAGMSSAEVQLMAYDADYIIKGVQSSSALVEVLSVEHEANKHYAFINLRLSPEFKATTIQLSMLTQSGESIMVDYEFKERKKGSAIRQGFSSKDVIYLVTPDRFANGDTENDSVDGLTEKVDRSKPGGRHGGDLLGLQQHLAYLSDLGISKVWLNPLQQNNEPNYSYHGYSISDLYEVDARYGGNQALLSFSSAARQKGIGLIMDTIPNHIGVNHWWMQDLPSDDWINNQGEFTQTSHNHEAVQDPYAPESDTVAFNDGWFVPTMPDLNQRNKKLANYLIQNNIWWIEYADLAGLRVDTLPYADKNFTTDFNKRILAEYPKLNIVGEEWTTNPAVVAYWQAGKNNLDGYDAGVPSLMDFPVQDALVKAMLEPEEGRSGLRRLHTMLANDFQYPDPQNLVVIGDNHDMSRLHTQLNEDIQLTKMALTFLMTTRGIPQLFYGTEILMSNKGSDDHGVIRSDFPGGWAGDKSNARTGTGLSAESLEMQSFVRTLLNWRKTSAPVHTGTLVHYLPKEGVYVYFRQGPNDDVMVVMNKNDTVTSLGLSRFDEVLSSRNTMRNVFTSEASQIPEALKIKAKSALVFELK